MQAPMPPSPVSTVSISWGDVLDGVCAHRADTGERLAAYLDAHPGDVAAWCLKGFAHLALGRVDRRVDAAAAEATARAAHVAGGSARDGHLLAALTAWRHDRPLDAVDAFDAMLADDPRDLLAVKLQHGLFLMLGQPGRMRVSLERVLPHWTTTTPGMGFVLGCHAFSLEETGAFALAEAAGRRAVALQPDDAWGIHAVAHVFESLGRAREGLAWLRDHADGYDACNVFRGHVHWHRALLHFQLEEFAEALDIYDAHVATPWVGDYRDMSNAVSLLWRLESEGVDVGGRWQRLAGIAAQHVQDQGSAYAMAHYAVALGRGAGHAVLAHAIDGMPGPAQPGTRPDSQQAIVAAVGRPLCGAIRDLCAGDPVAAGSALSRLEHQLVRLGGSNAQRELFSLMLIEASLAAGDVSAVRRLVEARLAQRPGDPWLKARVDRCQ